MVWTTESYHEHRTSSLLGTPSLKAAGYSWDPLVFIARCRLVMCILHCCMALGRQQMANIRQLANDQLSPGDHVTRAAIRAPLHEHRTGCRLGKDVSPDGEETSCLFAACSPTTSVRPFTSTVPGAVVGKRPPGKVPVDARRLLSTKTLTP